MDAPLARDIQSDSDDDEDGGRHHGSDSDSGTEEEHDEGDEESESDSDSDSDSAPEFDAAEEDDEEEDDGQGGYEESGPNAPRISIPDGVVDIKDDDGDEELKGTRRAVWHDPSDERITVNMEGDKRLKKLARGKGKKSVVNGQELQRKLKEQYVLSFASIEKP